MFDYIYIILYDMKYQQISYLAMSANTMYFYDVHLLSKVTR